MRRFGLKMGIDFVHFCLESAMVFGGNYASVLMYLSFQFQRNEKERVICESEFDSDKSFCWSSCLKPNDIISACSRSENRYGL